MKKTPKISAGLEKILHPITSRPPYLFTQLVAKHLPSLFRHADPDEAVAAIAALGWGPQQAMSVALAIDDWKKDELRLPDGSLRPTAVAVLRSLDRAGARDERYQSLRKRLEKLGILEAPKPSAIPALPARLPLDLKELRSFAKLLGDTFDESAPEDAGPLSLHLNGGPEPEELLERHLAEWDGEPVDETPPRIDVRRLKPFDGLEHLGWDGSGDTIQLDPRLRTKAGTPPVVRICHDESLAAILEANGVYELAARGILDRWAGATRNRGAPEVERLLATSVELAKLPPLAAKRPGGAKKQAKKKR